MGIGDNNISLSTTVNQVLSPVDNDIFMGLGCKHTICDMLLAPDS